MDILEANHFSRNGTMSSFKQVAPASHLKSLILEATRLGQAHRTALLDRVIFERLLARREAKKKQRFTSKSQKILQRAALALGLSKHAAPKQPVPTKKTNRFRNISRFIIRLVRICKSCRESLTYNVRQEKWYALIENIVVDVDLSNRRKGGVFVTFIPNENRELVQLTFDAGSYAPAEVKQAIVTDEARGILKMPTGTRSVEEITLVMRCLNSVSPAFACYPWETQKEICQYGIYDRYQHSRVIIRQGLPPHGMYFVLGGILVEKERSERKHAREIRTGETFGEDDIISGTYRQSTVVTKSTTELLFIHKYDFKRIFDMSTNTYDPRSLEICRQHAVFQHFPLQRLIDNPGVWSIWKYRHGRLIVRDCNVTDWIYIIKSGEARVLKYLEPGTVDVKARRRKIKALLEMESPYHQMKKILNFVSDRDGSKSVYNRKLYHPGFQDRGVSAPVSHMRRERPTIVSSKSLPVTPACRDYTDRSHDLNQQSRPSSKYSESPNLSSLRSGTKLPYIQTPKPETISEGKKTKDCENITVPRIPTASGVFGMASDSKDLNKTFTPRFKGRKTAEDVDPNSILPPFVLIETLHPGEAFGFRSCLEPEEQGPSTSLVSAECEVIQINKKFFMKHADEAVYSLIRLKAKPFPTQEEVVDRLDANVQWTEYRQDVIKDFIWQLNVSKRRK